MEWCFFAAPFFDEINSHPGLTALFAVVAVKPTIQFVN